MGWIIWSLVVLAAGLGLLGAGWLSRRAATSADGAMTVRYEKFLRYHKQAQLELTCRGDRPANGELRISLGQPLLDRMQILRIEPEPARGEVTSAGVVYVFPRESAAGSVKLVVHFQPERYGTMAGDVALVGSDPVRVEHFVYP